MLFPAKLLAKQKCLLHRYKIDVTLPQCKLDLHSQSTKNINVVQPNQGPVLKNFFVHNIRIFRNKPKRLSLETISSLV